mmetsp:Transcript_37688/g.97224  ORF Transcript_37688/g.97224 Transcript_37688/m.97224 type:complete len:202 (-) Transcript_37688:1713-2318(-)
MGGFSIVSSTPHWRRTYCESGSTTPFRSFSTSLCSHSSWRRSCRHRSRWTSLSWQYQVVRMRWSSTPMRLLWRLTAVCLPQPYPHPHRARLQRAMPSPHLSMYSTRTGLFLLFRSAFSSFWPSPSLSAWSIWRTTSSCSTSASGWPSSSSSSGWPSSSLSCPPQLGRAWRTSGPLGQVRPSRKLSARSCLTSLLLPPCRHG